MSSHWIVQLEGYRGWKLRAAIVVLAVLLAEVIVSAMGWLLKGEVSYDYLLTGLVAASVVAPVTLFTLTRLLDELAINRQQVLQTHARAEFNLNLAIEAAQMVLWELDFVTGQIRVDRSRLPWLGLAADTQVSNLQHWLNLLHPDDRVRFEKQLRLARRSVAEDFRLEYRIARPQGGWSWVVTRGRAVSRDEHGAVLTATGGSLNITPRKEAELALRASEQESHDLSTLLRLIGDNVPDMIWAKDLHKRYLFANKAICEQLLFASSTDEPLGRTDLDFALRERGTHPADAQWHTFGELCQDSDTLTLARGRASQFDEYGNVRGQFMFLDVHKAPFVNDAGEVIGVVGSARNVTAQKAAEDKLRLASLVLENSGEAMMVTDPDNAIIEINPAFTRLTGYSREEVLGKNPAMLHSGRQTASFYRDMWQQIDASGHWQGELWNRRKDGTCYAQWQTISTIRHPDGTVQCRVGLFSDITDKKVAQEVIWSQANFDPLTKLPNRSMFQDRLSQELKKTQRTVHKLALLFIDLDNFKEVNDTLGHDAGDLLLVEAAQRIASCVRDSDTVARLGGDEFTVILSGIDDPGRVELIAHNILQALLRPYTLVEDVVNISASIGIALYPDDATSQEELLKDADRAMYAAKNAGRNRFSYYTQAMQVFAQERQHMLHDLRGALQNGQLQLHFQPIVDLRSGQLHKVEALLRWLHPQRGMVSPAEFIPLAEESGLIHSIGNWVFGEAARQARRWRERYGRAFQISLNVSPIQLLQADVRRIGPRNRIDAGGFSGQCFVIEISEKLLQSEVAGVSEKLQEFRDAGVQLAIDDFGDGYAALFQLKKLHIDYFKIEKTFIQQLASGEGDVALATAIVVMAHRLGLKVIAEGVETIEQHRLLLAMGCDFAQGFYYAKPLAAAEVETLLEQDSLLCQPVRAGEQPVV
jgi:diguanylate cyclase (GGDEF)-like protein/PAS domain S-box-containing protein